MSNNNTNAERQMLPSSKIRMRYLIFAGITLVIIGFVYNVIYAGIPYQDPPPELLKKYNSDSAISEVIICSGILLLISGLVGVIVKENT